MGIKGGYGVKWIPEDCTLCGVCTKACRDGALTQTENEIALDKDKCTNCGRCVKACPFNAWEGKSGYLVSFGGNFGKEEGHQILKLKNNEDGTYDLIVQKGRDE